MSWNETVKVQTIGGQANQNCLNYLTEFKQKIAVNEDPIVRIYKNADLAPQHMVCLEWKSESTAAVKSNFSKELIHELKQFGIVSYSAWIISDQEKGSK